MTPYTIAAAQYPLDQLSSWAAYVDKLERWVAEAAAGGAAADPAGQAAPLSAG